MERNGGNQMIRKITLHVETLRRFYNWMIFYKM